MHDEGYFSPFHRHDVVNASSMIPAKKVGDITSVFTAGRIPQFDTARISKFSDDLYKREDGISHAVYVKRYSVIINDIQERLIS